MSQNSHQKEWKCMVHLLLLVREYQMILNDRDLRYQNFSYPVIWIRTFQALFPPPHPTPRPWSTWGQDHVSTWYYFCPCNCVSWGRANPGNTENLLGSNSYTRTVSKILAEHTNDWIADIYPTNTKISVSQIHVSLSQIHSL